MSKCPHCNARWNPSRFLFSLSWSTYKCRECGGLSKFPAWQMTLIAAIIGALGAGIFLPAIRGHSSLWYFVFCLLGMGLFVALMYFFCSLVPLGKDKP